MDKITADKAQKELTMILLYLSRFTNNDRVVKSDDVYSWKGYDFDILNSLDDEDYIRQGERPSRRKSVYFTETGIDYAKELIEKYGIKDWD